MTGRAAGKISPLDWTVCLAVLLPSLSSDNKVVASEEGLIEKFYSGIILFLSVQSATIQTNSAQTTRLECYD